MNPEDCLVGLTIAVGTVLKWYDFAVHNIRAAPIFNRLFSNRSTR
jgi:hypothetical protein